MIVPRVLATLSMLCPTLAPAVLLAAPGDCNHTEKEPQIVARMADAPPPFTQIAAGLPGAYLGQVAWGDYDNDGDPDIVLTGWIGGSWATRLYRNQGAGVFTNVSTSLPAVEYGSLAWGDYDNDGDLDLVLSGFTAAARITKVYRNNGNGTFTDSGVALLGVDEGAAAWGDFDNDGYLDLAVAGGGAYSHSAKIYRNNRVGGLVDIGAGLPGVSAAAVAWGDYDADGDLDLFLRGHLYMGDGIARLFRNMGIAGFVDSGLVFTPAPAGSVAWGDFDNDSHLDVLVGPRLYRNNGDGAFSDIGMSLEGGFASAWGDYDNDGFLDILITGASSGSLVGKLYHNQGDGSFVDTGAVLTAMIGAVGWADYDGDGDLDILMCGDAGSPTGYVGRLYRNENGAANALPTAPAGLTSELAVGAAQLAWLPATDQETPVAGLTYNVRAATTPGGIDVLSPMASAATGQRLLPAPGNAGNQTASSIRNLQPGTYYWSVQAVDTAFAGSLPATESTFTVCDASVDPESSFVAGCGGTATIAVSADPGCTWTAASKAAWLSIDAGHSGTGTGIVTFSAAANPGLERTGVLAIAAREITVTQASGCSISIAPASVSVPAAGINYANVAVTASAPACPWTGYSNDFFLSLSAMGPGSKNVSYMVFANTGPARTGTATIGGNTFTVNQASGCTYSLSPASTCFQPEGGSASVTVTTATGCTWSVSNALPWVTLPSGGSGTGSGTFSYDVQPNTGVARTGTLTAGGQTHTVRQGPLATITVPQQVCALSAGNAASVPNAGTGATYAWVATNATITAGAGTRQVVFTAGQEAPVGLSVTVTPTIGCASSSSVSIAVNQPPATTITMPAAVCAGAPGVGASVADAGPGATYAWSITNGTITGGAGTSMITFTAGATGPVAINVTVTTAAGCSAAGSATVAVNALPTATIAAPASACAGSSGHTASVADAGPGARYAWSITNGTITGGDGTNAIVFSAGEVGPAVIGVTVTTASSCSVTGNATVAVNASPSAAITAPPAACAGSAGHAASVPDAGPGATYAWSVTNGTITAGAGTSAIAFSVGEAGPSVIDVAVTTTAGCSAAGSAAVAVNALPSAVATAPAAVCAASAGHAASVADAGPGASYAWTITNGTIAGGDGTPAITFAAGATGETSLYVSVQSAQGCTAAGSAAVAISPLPQATVTAPVAVCASSGSNAASVPDAGAGAAYTWTIANGTIASGQGTPSITFTAGTSGTVAIGVTITSGSGCSAAGAADVAISPTPAATVTTPATACSGSAGNTASVPDAGAGAAYAWTIDNGTITAGNGTRTITFTVGSSGSTALGVTVTTAAGCSAPGSASVAVNALPPATITAPAAVCRNSTGNAASVPDAGAGAAYAWAISGGTITAGGSTRTVTFTAGSSGTVTLGATVTSAAGCQATGSAGVPIDQTPVATITAAAAVCAGSTGNAASVADAGAGATYTWTITNGAITSGAGTRQVAFTAGTGGTVALGVTVRTLGGCQATASKSVTINALPSATITAPTSVPRNSKNKAASVPTAGTGATYVWTITNGTITSGQGTRAIKFTAGSTPGTLTLTVVVTKSNGCSNTGTKNVTVT